MWPSHFSLRLEGPFSNRFPNQNCVSFYVSSIRLACSAHNNTLDFTALALLGSLYKTRSSFFCKVESHDDHRKFMKVSQKLWSDTHVDMTIQHLQPNESELQLVTFTFVASDGIGVSARLQILSVSCSLLLTDSQTIRTASFIKSTTDLFVW
jgi:hypothetical protein